MNILIMFFFLSLRFAGGEDKFSNLEFFVLLICVEWAKFCKEVKVNEFFPDFVGLFEIEMHIEGIF